MTFFIYASNYTLLISLLLDVRIKNKDRRFSFGLIRIFFLAPLLAGEYFYLGVYMQGHLVTPLFFSEIVFGLMWIVLAYNLPNITEPFFRKPAAYFLALFAFIAGISFICTYWLINRPAFEIIGYNLILPYHGQLYFSSLFLLISVLVMAWRAEAFWRTLPQKDRWLYKYLVIGILLICVSLGWTASFRIAYMRMMDDHLLLLSICLLTAWFLIGYAMIRNRLLNRKIFVSRKVVYSTIAPMAFASYLIALGIISLLMRSFGWSLHSVLQWLIIVAGLLLITVFALSSRIRAKVKFFISTHFYVNKYEYRDEWLAFSSLLQGKLSENDVVEALRQILHDSLYTDTIKIWLGSSNSGFRLTGAEGKQGVGEGAFIAGNDPLVAYFKNKPYLDCLAYSSDSVFHIVLREKKEFFNALGIVLMVPLVIDGQSVGLIGLGPESTGGKYGLDDFDLLAALGSQAASALLAVSTAEELARVREKSAWESLSAFVLHDLKNAATILAMVRDNAPSHIHKPEFQKDILVSVDDALKRMAKVQMRLGTLKNEIVPIFRLTDICQMIRRFSRHLEDKLPDLNIELKCPDEIRIDTDPEFVAVVIENIVLNALEAVGGEARVLITIEEVHGKSVLIKLSDNGPGILSDMLPDRLFEPFATGKPKGSGIGLWQVKQLLESLGGKIEAQNDEGGGAQFIIYLPFHSDANERQTGDS